MSTGFTAYHVYNAMRYMHMKAGDYDATSMKLPRHDRYLAKWNNEIVNRTVSTQFQKLDERFRKNQLVRLFSYYLVENPNAYVTTVFDDEFSAWKKYEWELANWRDHLHDHFSRVLVEAAERHGGSLRAMLFSDSGFPPVAGMLASKKLSVNAFAMLDMAFGVVGRIDRRGLNIVERDRISRLDVLSKKYTMIVTFKNGVDGGVLRKFLQGVYDSYR